MVKRVTDEIVAQESPSRPRMPRTVWYLCGSTYCFYPERLADVCLEVSLDPALEGDGTGGAADAGTVETDLDDAFGGDVDEFEVSAVGLDGWADEADDPLDFLAEFARGSLDGRFHT